jgi:hypothetical protein
MTAKGFKVTKHSTRFNISPRLVFTLRYVVLELWGRRDGGSTDTCLGACRLLVSASAPSHGPDFSWVSLHRASSLRASIQVQLGWKATQRPVTTAILPSVTQMFPAPCVSELYVLHFVLLCWCKRHHVAAIVCARLNFFRCRTHACTHAHTYMPPP